MFQQRGVSEDVPVVKVSLAEEGLMSAMDGVVELRAEVAAYWPGWRVRRVRRRGSWLRMR